MTQKNAQFNEIQRRARSANIKRQYMEQFRCHKCNRLLAKSNKNGDLNGSIKCPRCGEMNER